MRSRLSLFSALVVTACITSCGSGQATRDTVPNGNEPIALQRGTATAAEGATVLALTCDEGAAERCDALDDDCDGRIDEGCGYAEGVVAIVATWGDGADVDLVLTSNGASGLHSPETHSGRGECGRGEAHPRIESAAFRGPVAGELRVSLAHVDTCHEDDASVEDGEDGEDDSGPSTTTGSVSIAIDGEVVGAFNVTLTPGETTEVATLTLSD